MPARKLTTRQRAHILRKLRHEPSIPYADFARQYDMTVPGIRQMVLRAMPGIDPDWKHVDKGRKVRVCDECGQNWTETRGYSGPTRKFCEQHRKPNDQRDSTGRFRKATA